MSATEALFCDPRTIRYPQELFGSKRRFNPRTLANHGFSPERMDELRRGIARDGLNHALLVRIVDKDKVLVAGERRLRAVQGLMELDEQALKRINAGEKDVDRVLVKNPVTRKMEPALDVFGKLGVEYKISDAKDEKEALRQAIEENTQHESLTDYEMLLQCDVMEQEGISRAEQAATMGNLSEAWISQSHALLNSHPDILKYMERGQLTRTAALTFLKVDKDKIAATLKRAVDLTFKEAEEKEVQAIAEVGEALDDLQRGNGELTLANFTGNHESARKAHRHIARAGKSLKKAEKKLNDAQAKKKRKISVETIAKAAKDVHSDGNLKRPQSMKHVRLIEEELAQLLLKSDDKTLVNPVNHQEYDRKDIEIVHLVLGWQLSMNDLEHPLDAILRVRDKKKAKK